MRPSRTTDMSLPAMSVFCTNRLPKTQYNFQPRSAVGIDSYPTIKFDRIRRST